MKLVRAMGFEGGGRASTTDKSSRGFRVLEG